jgi:hypothetical protein
MPRNNTTRDDDPWRLGLAFLSNALDPFWVEKLRSKFLSLERGSLYISLPTKQDELV